MRLDKSKDCSFQEYLETSSEFSMLVQFENRSRERNAVLPNKVACNRSLRHFTSCLLATIQPSFGSLGFSI